MINLIKSQLFKESKTQNKSPFLCNQVKMFGFCKGPCLERHELCKTLDEQCLNIPSKCFINIQLIKILSASHFYGRILKYSTMKDPTKDQDWIYVDDSFEIIKNELKQVGLSLNNKIVHKNPVIGELVMIETEQEELLRAVILDIVHGWFSVKVKVKLIDLGHTDEINSNNVFILPRHLKKFRPVAVEIILSSMEPVEVDHDSDWPVTTTQIVRSLFEPVILTNLNCICKVTLKLGITLWIDWILVKKCNKCSHFTCKLYTNPVILPRELIERNLVKANSQLFDKLMNLDKNTHIWKEYLSIDKSYDDPLVIKKSNIPLFSSEERKTKTDEVIQIQWAHLLNDEMYYVSIVYVESPKCFIVRNLKFLDRIDALQKDIDKAINNNTVEKITSTTVGTVCLAVSPENNSKYNRVLIDKIDEQTVDVFYVDYGEFYRVNIETLLTIPSNLITKLPFQVIECNLGGFKEILQTNINDQFSKKLIQLTNTPMYLKVLSSVSDAKITGGKCYEVVLFNNCININSTMAHEFSTYVHDIKIQTIISSNYKYKDSDSDNDNDNDNEFYEEDLEIQCELLENLLNQSMDKNKEQIKLSDTIDVSQDMVVNKSTKTIEKQIVTNSFNFNQDTNIHKQYNEQKESIQNENKYCVNCNVNQVIPQCLWHQDKESIYLKLNILSVKSYNISHTMDTITINVESNSVSYNFTAVLYAFITKELFTYHESFDGIHIKAQKLIKVKYRWPRLLKCLKKHRYIIYDPEYVDERKNSKLLVDMINKYKMMGLGQPLNTLNDDSDNTSSDDDLNEYTIFED